MGCLASNEAKINKKIEQEAIDTQSTVEKKKVKLLFLGPGDSGKSTILKQLRLIHGIPLTQQEKERQVPVVHHNVIKAMKVLLVEAQKLGYGDDITFLDEFSTVSVLDDNAILGIEVGKAIKKLWNNPAISRTWEQRNQFQIDECIAYFIQRIDVISQPGYVVTQEDSFHIKVRTNCVVKEKFKVQDAIYEMYDVGGQRNERRKWIHCFDNVSAVIFVAALSEYDQCLYENSDVNRMAEALELFAEVCNMPYFENTSIILFMNKKDLFEEKIKVCNISSVSQFSDFAGGLGNFNAGVDYFVKKFVKANTHQSRAIYYHITCATDTENIQNVWYCCKDTILREKLVKHGII